MIIRRRDLRYVTIQRNAKTFHLGQRSEDSPLAWVLCKGTEQIYAASREPMKGRTFCSYCKDALEQMDALCPTGIEYRVRVLRRSRWDTKAAKRSMEVKHIL